MIDNNTDDELGVSEPELTEDGILELHELDMLGALFDDEQIPIPPDGVEEPQSESGGTKPVDIQEETPNLDELIQGPEEVGLGDIDIGVDPDLPDLEDL